MVREGTTELLEFVIRTLEEDLTAAQQEKCRKALQEQDFCEAGSLLKRKTDFSVACTLSCPCLTGFFDFS